MKKNQLRVYRSNWFQRNYKGYLFILPFFVLFFLFTILPVATSIYQSFTSYNMLQPAKYVGFDNYKKLFLNDDIFIIAVKNTAELAVIVGPLSFVLSFLMAWIISTLKFRNLFSLAFYVPSITSGVAMSVVWLYIFANDRYGLINNVLLRLGIITEPILWTLDTGRILGVVIFISAWMSMGTGFLTFLAGIRSIPPEYLEAARIDGLNGKLQEFRYIIFPVMKPQCLFAAINSIVASLGAYDIAVAVAGMPSPEYSAHTIVAHIYDYAFTRFDMGYASAIATFLFALSYLLGIIVRKMFASDD